MAKKVYSGPIFFELTPGEDPNIVLPPSQTTSGYDTPYSFQGFGEEYEAELTMLEANADDFQLQPYQGLGCAVQGRSNPKKQRFDGKRLPVHRRAARY